LQADRSTPASFASYFNIRHNWTRLARRPGFQRPVIDGVRMFIRGISLGALASSLLVAQDVAPDRRANAYHAPASPPVALVSPELHADRTVTFRIRAATASDVRLSLDGDHPMVKDADGIWGVTLGPLEPEIYEYSFRIGGARVIDTGNKLLKTGAFAASLLDVPANPPRFDQIQDVPHGTIQIRSYTSTPYKKQRGFYVYLPPQYDREPSRRFPVLYLRHGNGDDEAAWTIEGRAGVILENLIAEGKAVPMIIVMPYGESNASGGGTPEGIAALGKELLDDVIPLVDKNYRTLTGRDNRAIAGLSMGGGQAFTIGLQHLDRFAWVGEFSSGVLSDADFRIEKYMPGLIENAADLNQRLRLLFLSCGSEDPRYQGQLDLRDALAKYKIRHEWYSTPGVHEWKVWRHSLHEFLPRLFQPPRTGATEAY
jgi:enterochelin esterase family protein